MLIIFVFDEASDHGLGPEIVLRIVPFILPKALMYAMPATCLLSVCVVFGRMSADNEIVALKSLGLHQSVIIVPTLAVAFLLSLFAVWVNDVSFAWSHWGIEKIVLESSDKIVYGVLRNEGSYRTDDFSIEVQAVEDNKLIQPIITYRNGDKTSRVVAHEARVNADPENHELVFALMRGTADIADQGRLQFDDEQEFKVPLMSSEDVAKATRNPSHLYLSQISTAIDQQVVDLQRLKTDQAIRACGQMLSGNLLGLTDTQWEQRENKVIESQQRLGRLRVVPHRRWANGFSCFAFAMIGIPMAIRLRTANYATTFGVCFLPILFLYYPLFMFGLTGAKMGTLPPIAAWFGNAACLLVGAILMFREFKR